MMELPIIRQGGMGIDISIPSLGNKVSRLGGYGTVSGVVAGTVLARRLQLGDIGGHYRRALAHFPFPEIAEQVLEAYFVAGGILPCAQFKPVPMFTLNPSNLLIALTVCANFCLVWLAKEGHGGPIAINFLEKVQLSLIYGLVGAMLAGVDEVTAGAGIPIQIPGILDAIAAGRNPAYEVDATIADKKGTVRIEFDLIKFFRKHLPKMKRPGFIPIIGTHVLAEYLASKCSSTIEGFVVELPPAGGHVVRPRGIIRYDDFGEPIYDPIRDMPNWGRMVNLMRKLGLPWWVGGDCASPEKLAWAKSIGATGVQVGGIMASSRESGERDDLRRRKNRLAYRNELLVKTDMSASPTGFPFKLTNLTDRDQLALRTPKCTHGALVEVCIDEKGHDFYRCPAEPIKDYLRKGGNIEKTKGVVSLCNGLFGNSQIGGPGEIPTQTYSSKFAFIRELLTDENGDYGVEDAMNYLLS